jgi:hypothetical protein
MWAEHNRQLRDAQEAKARRYHSEALAAAVTNAAGSSSIGNPMFVLEANRRNLVDEVARDLEAVGSGPGGAGFAGAAAGGTQPLRQVRPRTPEQAAWLAEERAQAETYERLAAAAPGSMARFGYAEWRAKWSLAAPVASRGSVGAQADQLAHGSGSPKVTVAEGGDWFETDLSAPARGGG